MKINFLKFIALFVALISIKTQVAQVNHLVISQVYGGGGGSNPTYGNDFIEIFNPTGSSVSLSGWSVQYGSSGGTGAWSVTALTGSIAPGAYYLVAESGTGSSGTFLTLPTADATGTIAMSASAGKVALVNSTTALNGACPTSATIIDKIGYGSAANCSETSPTANLSSTASAKRNNNGCTDTDANASDFTNGTPLARNSASTPVYCYPTKFVISTITPASPTAGSGFNVTILAQDAGNNQNNVLTNTAFSLTTNGNAGTISGATTGTITAGTNSVVISGVVLSSAGTGVTLTATRTSGDQLSAGTSSNFTVQSAGGTPTKLTITSITPASPIAGTGFNVTVESQDGSNVAQNVSASTSISLSTNGNAGTIGGTTTGTINSGSSSVTINGVTLANGGTGVTLTATRTTGDVLTAGTSATFTVLGIADHLTFLSVPSSGSTGVNLSTFTVEARRADNSVDVNYTGNITVSKASGPGTLSGTTTVAAVSGIATFSDLQLDQAGTYTLNTTSGSLNSDNSNSIVISQSPVTWNFNTANPSSGTPYANLNISSITQGNSNGAVTMLSTTSPSSGYTGSSAGNNAGIAARVGAINTGTNGSAYFEFTLTPASGYYVTLNGISFGSRSTGTGPAAFSIRSSVDNYVSTAATATLSTSSTWALSSPTFSSVSSTTGSAITFRIYGHGGTGTPGASTANWRIDDVTLNLSVQLCVVPTSFNVTGGGSFCSGGAGVSVGLSGSQSGNTYQLQLNGVNTGTPLSGTGSAISFGNQTNAGVYTVVATNPNGSCSQSMTGSVSVVVNPMPSASINSFTDVTCNGGTDGSATVTATGGVGYSYNWSPSGGTSTTATGLIAGNYTCTVTENSGCVTTTTVSISEPTPLNVSAGSDISICSGSSASLTAVANGGSGSYSYQWAPGNMTTSGISVAPTSTTNYTVNVVDANGCVSFDNLLVTVNNLPNVSASASPATICSGDACALTAIGADTYLWSTTATNNPTSVSPTSTSTYTVTGTDNNGCVNTATVSVNVTTCSTTPAEALSFDGIDDVINGTNNSLPQGISARSFSAWIKPTQVSSTQTIFSYGGTGINESSSISINGGNLYYSSGSNDMSGTSVSAIAANVWTHVVVTLSNKTVKFYVNGLLKYTGTLTTSPATLGTNWSISSSTTPFSGWMDEVSVWNTIMTSTQITSSMNQEMSAQTGLIGLYHFNQGFAASVNTSVTTATDASSSASTGTLSGFALTGASSNWVAPGRSGKTKLKDVHCGTTLTTFNTQLFAELVSNATNYQWEFTDLATSSVYTYTRGAAQNNFTPANFPQLTYNKTYSVQVRAFVNGAWGTYGESCSLTSPPSPTTQLHPSFCGITLNDLGTLIYCTKVTNCSDYEWEFTDLSNSNVYTYIRGLNSNDFNFNSIPQLTYNKTYNVRVRLNFGGTWGAFGNTCQIVTPDIPTTQLNTVCGTTIANNTQLYCGIIPKVTNYTWEFTNTGTSQVYTVNRGSSLNNFYLYMLPNAPAGNYDVRVKGVCGAIDGQFGTVCNITFNSPSGRIAQSGFGSEENISEDQFYILFPNPGTGLFTFKSNMNNMQIEITDALGRIVYKNESSLNEIQIDITSYDSGLYFFKALKDGKLQYSTIIVKQ